MEQCALGRRVSGNSPTMNAREVCSSGLDDVNLSQTANYVQQLLSDSATAINTISRGNPPSTIVGEDEPNVGYIKKLLGILLGLIQLLGEVMNVVFGRRGVSVVTMYAFKFVCLSYV